MQAAVYTRDRRHLGQDGGRETNQENEGRVAGSSLQVPASVDEICWAQASNQQERRTGARGRQKRPGSHRRPFLASQAPRGTGHAPRDNLEALTRPDLIPLSTEALEHAEPTGTLRTASVALAP